MVVTVPWLGSSLYRVQRKGEGELSNFLRLPRFKLCTAIKPSTTMHAYASAMAMRYAVFHLLLGVWPRDNFFQIGEKDRYLNRGTSFIRLDVTSMSQDLLTIYFYVPASISKMKRIPSVTQYLYKNLFYSICVSKRFLSIMSTHRLVPIMFPIDERKNTCKVLFVDVSVGFRFIFATLLRPRLVVTFYSR